MIVSHTSTARPSDVICGADQPEHRHAREQPSARRSSGVGMRAVTSSVNRSRVWPCLFQPGVDSAGAGIRVRDRRARRQVGGDVRDGGLDRPAIQGVAAGPRTTGAVLAQPEPVGDLGGGPVLGHLDHVHPGSAPTCSASTVNAALPSLRCRWPRTGQMPAAALGAGRGRTLRGRVRPRQALVLEEPQRVPGRHPRDAIVASPAAPRTAAGRPREGGQAIAARR